MTGCAQGPSEEPSPPRQPSGGSPAPCGPPNSYQPCCSISCCCFPSPSLWQVSFSTTSLANPPASPFHLTAASFSLSSLCRGEGGCSGRCRGRTPPQVGQAGRPRHLPAPASSYLLGGAGTSTRRRRPGGGLGAPVPALRVPLPGRAAVRSSAGAARRGGTSRAVPVARCPRSAGRHGTFWWFAERSMLPATSSPGWKGTRGSLLPGSPGDTESRGRKFHRRPEVLPAVIRT